MTSSTRNSLALLVMLIVVGGCASKPVADPIDVHFDFCLHQGEVWACLSEADVAKLREALIRCQNKPAVNP